MKLSLRTKKALSFFAALALMAMPMVALGQFDPGQGQGGTGLEDTSIYDIITTVMNWLLLIITVIAVIGFIVSGILFITAGGSGKQEQAKGYLMYSIVGIIVALIGYIVVNLVSTLLGGTVQN